MTTSRLRQLLIILAVFMLGMRGAVAAFPDRPIKLIVPYAPGGITDTFARVIAEGVSKELGQPVIIDNKPGAGATVGSAIAAKAPADGYTLLLSSNANLVMGPMLYKNAGYDAKRDLRVLSIGGEIPSVILAHPQAPFNTVREFANYAKTKPGKVSYASLGNGNVLYLGTRMLESTIGTEMVEVPYKGSIPSLTALMAGEVDLYIDVTPSALPFVKSGKLKALAVPTRTRLAIFPNVPTLAEAGYPELHVASWVGISAPAGIPEDVAARLSAALDKVVETPEFRERFAGLGMTMFKAMSRDKIESFLEADRAQWAGLIQRFNVQAQ